jgi:hypothetical protein
MVRTDRQVPAAQLLADGDIRNGHHLGMSAWRALGRARRALVRPPGRIGRAWR